MRILYLHQYFNTPAQGGSLRSYYIAKAMKQAGHHVTVITTHNHLAYQKQDVEGIEVHYLPIAYQNAFGFWQRIRAFFYFARASYKFALTLPAHDCLYATSTPLTIGLSAMWISQKLKIPYIFEVRDLWPLVPIQLGILRNPLAKWLTKRWERQIYKQASQIVALSPAMQAHIKAIVPQKQVTMVSNMTNLAPAPAYKSLEKPMKIAYFGTVGYANHLEYLVEIARTCAESRLEVEFWIVGKGARYDAVKTLAEQYTLKNIHFWAHQNAFEVQTLLQKVDAIYVSFLDNPVLASTSPNKFFEGLGAGKVCIVNVQGWLRELVEQNECGFYANPQSPAEFVAQIEPFLQNPALLLKYQQNARALAEREFSVEHLAKKVVDLLGEIYELRL